MQSSMPKGHALRGDDVSSQRPLFAIGVFDSEQEVSGRGVRLGMNHPFRCQPRRFPIALFAIAVVLAALWVLESVSGTTIGSGARSAGACRHHDGVAAAGRASRRIGAVRGATAPQRREPCERHGLRRKSLALPSIRLRALRASFVVVPCSDGNQRTSSAFPHPKSQSSRFRGSGSRRHSGRDRAKARSG